MRGANIRLSACSSPWFAGRGVHRRRYGPLTTGLAVGAFRDINGDEVDALRRAGEEAQRRVSDEVEGESVPLAAEASSPSST